MGFQWRVPAAEVQGDLLLTGSWDEQSPARSAGYVGSTGGDGVAAPHFGVGQPFCHVVCEHLHNLEEGASCLTLFCYRLGSLVREFPHERKSERI